MNKIIEIGTDYVIVQPGLVKGVLDKELKKKGKFLPPDPASSNYCTIGGMIANNSSGAHCLGYGNTIDFLEAIRVVYSDGMLGMVGDKNVKLDNKMTFLRRLLLPYVNLIQKHYPKVNKNSCGYRLDAVVNNQEFSPHKIFAASEGTLGILTSAKMKIIDIPLYRHLLVLGFENLSLATSAVTLILKFLPVALEMLDYTVIHHTSNALQLSNSTGCILFIEFAGDKIEQVERKYTYCRRKLSEKSVIIESATDEESIMRIWKARKNALNNITKLTVGSRKPIGLIEDTVVFPKLLHKYTQYLQQLYFHYKLDYVMYGHVGSGNLHTRPLIDMDSKLETELIDHLANVVFNRVIRSGGTITGEHGDGMARVKYIQYMYGKDVFSLFRRIKKLFDPKYTMNPGKKVIPG